MEVEFDDDDLDRLETDAQFTAGFSQEVVRAYRKRMQQVRAFRDERDFYAVKALHFILSLIYHIIITARIWNYSIYF